MGFWACLGLSGLASSILKSVYSTSIVWLNSKDHWLEEWKIARASACSDLCGALQTFSEILD